MATLRRTNQNRTSAHLAEGPITTSAESSCGVLSIKLYVWALKNLEPDGVQYRQPEDLAYRLTMTVEEAQGLVERLQDRLAGVAELPPV